MRRNIILASILSIALLSTLDTLAQKKKKGQVTVPEFTMEAGQVIYSEEINQSGTSVDVLYDRCLKWFNGFYKNSGAVIKEKVAGQKIVGKPKFNVYLKDIKTGKKMGTSGLIGYTITISFKSNKYQYRITKINKKGSSYFGIEKMIAKNEEKYSHQYANDLVQVDEYMKGMIADLKVGMSVTGAKK